MNIIELMFIVIFIFMTQVIKLTEQDCIKVLKKLLKEQSTPPSDQYYTYDGVEYKRNSNGEWFYWNPTNKSWFFSDRSGLTVNNLSVYTKDYLEKMWKEKNPYLKLSNPKNAEKQQTKKSIYQTYDKTIQSVVSPKSKKNTPTKKIVTPADVALGKASEEEYKINYDAPAIGPDGCPIGYKIVPQEEIQAYKDKIIKPWNDTRTGPSNYKKINNNICRRVIYPVKLPEITLSTVMEAIREFLSGTAGTVITTILNLTGIGNLAIEIINAILLIYDYINKDWLNIIVDFLNLITGGTVMKTLGSVTKTMGKVTSFPSAMNKLKSIPQFKSILGTIDDLVESGIKFIKPFLLDAASFIDELFRTKWASKAVNAIIDFGEEFIKNLSVGEVKGVASQGIYQATTNETIKKTTRKVLLEYSKQKKYSLV